MPQILKVKPSHPELWESMIAETKKVLKGGGIIAFPTDTFYGLGANPYNTEAVDKIYSIKGRDPEKPLLLLIDSIVKLDGLVEEVSEASTKLLSDEGFMVEELSSTGSPDLYIDGADEITKNFHMIKGGGGALTREKIIAHASKKFVCIVDGHDLNDFLIQKFF